MSCTAIFQVSCPILESGEEDAVMCITGSCEQLGDWDPKRVVQMVQNSAEDSNKRIWKADVSLPCDSEIKYRYAICSFHKLTNGSTEEKVIVHRWETNVTPRMLFTEGVQLCQEEHIFGNYDDQQNTDTGWLTSQTEMHILIHGQPLTLQGCDEAPPFSIKVTARQERATTPEEETTSKKRKKVYDVLPVFIRVLNKNEYEPRLHQHEYGRHFHKDDIMMFSVQTLKPDTMSFKVEIFSQDIGDAIENLGVATILGRNVRCAPRCIPLIDQDMDNVGTLDVMCSIIKPLQPESVCNFEESYSKHWKSRRCVEIGHRGMGRSLVDKSLLVHIPTNSNIPENTVKSLQQALKHGADFVEFDIHVTKDRVPVIGHDFQAALTPSDVLGTQADTPLYLEVPINYLNLSEIDSLKTGQCMVLEHTDKKPSPCSSPARAPKVPKEMQLFPTLQFALEGVDLDLGFLVEVKYPMDIVEGSKEMPHEKHPLERNTLVDAIINILMKYGGKRRIILCAFDPQVCIMDMLTTYM
ncbi:glycerophosphocholine phosphodiesterase GPCPD1-like isoform X2 [Amphiura filiformis]|uniref:glycerophosphocholine phosphodiesterase GPCPD1-like isoform X2 n=1 Tax=Amphiura filiformis TaxID=82378 RepID=UPI003B211192